MLNAADEVAVAAFLDGRIGFTAIPEVIEAALDELGSPTVTHFEDLFAWDAQAREVAKRHVEAGRTVA